MLTCAGLQSPAGSRKVGGRSPTFCILEFHKRNVKNYVLRYSLRSFLGQPRITIDFAICIWQ